MCKNSLYIHSKYLQLHFSQTFWFVWDFDYPNQKLFQNGMVIGLVSVYARILKFKPIILAY